MIQGQRDSSRALESSTIMTNKNYDSENNWQIGSRKPGHVGQIIIIEMASSSFHQVVNYIQKEKKWKDIHSGEQLLPYGSEW